MLDGEKSTRTTNTRITDTSITDDATGRRDPATLTWRDVTLDDVRAARERIMPTLHRTPLVPTATLSRMSNTDLHLKVEAFQRTGSFKVRGALNACFQLRDEERERGVITMSAGNHGQATAFAAAQVDTRAVVFVPETAVQAKIDAIRGYGAELHFAPSLNDLIPMMNAWRIAHGLTFIPPFADPAILAGQGTVGLEILEDLPDVEVVVVPAGGGGLLSGIALTMKRLNPAIRVIGVEPEGASLIRRSLDAGICLAETPHSIADGLATPFTAPLTQSIIAHMVDDVVLVSDEEIIQAMITILERCKILVEPSGAAAVAALLSGKAGAAAGAKTVAVLSGGNIDHARLKTLL